MIRFILFILYCVPMYYASFGMGRIVMAATDNVFKATGMLSASFAFFMIVFWLVQRKIK